MLRWPKGDAGLFAETAADLDLGYLWRGTARYLSYAAYALPQGHGFAPGIVMPGADRAAPLDVAGIREDLSHSWMLGAAGHPSVGQTDPDARFMDRAALRHDLSGAGGSRPIRSWPRPPGTSARATQAASRARWKPLWKAAPVSPGETTPLSVQHIVRFFDFCMVCTVH